MELNPSELNDLASVDMMFAEMMIESGVNPLPSVCDNCDMTILEQDNRSVCEAFSRAEENINTLILALDMSMDLSNKDSISRVIDNLREKQQLIQNAKKDFNNPNFDFVELYKKLKKVQNKLGLNINCAEMNVLKLTEQTFDIEKTKDKVMKSAKELDEFLKEGEKGFQNFLNEEQTLDQENIPEKAKEKILEKKRKKELERENMINLQQTMTIKRTPPIKTFGPSRDR